MRLSEIKEGDVVKVLSININDKEIKRHILAMGIVRGTVIKGKKVAPMGDPICINLRNYELCISKKDIMEIIVEKI